MLPAQVLIFPAQVHDHNSAQLPLAPLVNNPKAQNLIKQQILVVTKIHQSYTADIK